MPDALCGLDGAPGGWVAAIEHGYRRHVLFVRHLTELDPPSVAAIDIPLGFPTGNGRRPAELAARLRLGPRRSSVFPTPPRAVLECRDYDEARRVATATTGRSITKQAWNLREKILEAASSSLPLLEAHPELAFAAMASAPMSHAKRTRDGRHERLAILATVGLHLESFEGHDDVPTEDAIDAVACLWVADRFSEGAAEALGSDFGPDDGPIHI